MFHTLLKFAVPISILAFLCCLGCSSDNKSTNGPAKPRPIPGDVNLNGIAYEVADAVLFLNYFVYGQIVFTIDREVQIAATDANGDGLILSLADLTYIIRRAVGDDRPNPNLDPVEAFYTIDVRGIIKIAAEVAAAALELRGNVEPTLLARNMDLEYAYDAANNKTRALVYSMEKGQTFSSKFLNTNGSELVSLEMATYEGAPFIATRVDSLPSLVLYQNRPNPFDGRTTIGFFLNFSTYVIFEIADEHREIVFDFKRYYWSDYHEIEWYGTDNSGHLVPDGVYQYSLTVNGQKKTKELILERHL